MFKRFATLLSITSLLTLTLFSAPGKTNAATTVQASVFDTLTVSVAGGGGSVSFPVEKNASIGTASFPVAITTNNTTGYTVSASFTNAPTGPGTAALYLNGTNSLPAVVDAAVSATTDGWALRATAAPAAGGTITAGLGDGTSAITTTGQQVYADSSGTGATETATFQARAGASTARSNGVYAGTLTVSATAQ